jgi:hypothetical protein
LPGCTHSLRSVVLGRLYSDILKRIMTVYSDGIGTLVLFFGLLASGAILLAELVFLAFGRFRQARNIFGWWSACAAGYVAMTIAVSLLTPQAIVNPGQAYCNDNWCISIRNVTRTQLEHDIAFRVDARVFSDANSTVRTSGKGVLLYLVDEHNRHFPLIADPAATPFDIELNPGQAVNTSLTFFAAADARPLFLKIDWPGNRLVKFLVKFAIGNDRSLLHQPTLLRV